MEKTPLYQTERLEGFPMNMDESRPAFDPAIVIAVAEKQQVVIDESQVLFVNELVRDLEELLLVNRKKILSGSRKRDCIMARYLFFYFLSTRTSFAQKTIGAFIRDSDGKGRDHSTVIHALGKHEEYLFRGRSEPEYMNALLTLLQKYGSRKVYYRYSRVIALMQMEKDYLKKYATVPIGNEPNALVEINNTDQHPDNQNTESSYQEQVLRQEFSILFEHMGLKNANHVIDNYFAGGRQKVLDEREKLSLKRRRV